MGLFDSLRRAFTTPQQITDAQNAQGMGNNTALGPGAPLTPVNGYSGRPRAMDYPTSVNIGYKNRQQWGRTSYEMLRELLRSYDLATICKNHKIDELRSMEPIFQVRDGFKGDADAAVEAAKAALAMPDREHPWDEWVSMWMDNILTFDSGPLYRRRNYDGDCIGLEVLDGSTIYPLIDEHGRRPHAPAPAYQQVIKGQVSQQFTAEDVLFTRFRPQSDAPYGMAPLESIVLNILTDVKQQWHFLQMFTAGNIPGGFMEAPPDLTAPEQIQEFQDYWNSTFDGDQEQKHKIVFVPAGSKFTQTMPQAFDPLFPEWLAKKTAMAFGVVPQDLGFTADVNRANGETQTDIQFRVNTLPWVRFIEGHITRYLQQDLQLPVEFRLNTGRDKEDRLADAQAHEIYVRMGIESPDEAREELLGLPVDHQRPIPRGMILPRQGFVPFDSILAISGKTDPETKAPAADAVLPYPFDGTPGLLPDKLPGGTEYKRAPENPDNPAAPATEHPTGDGVVAPVATEKDAAPGMTSATGVAGIDLVKPVQKKKHKTPIASGLCVIAQDTGRILMTQRGIEKDDPASGMWEFPGGHIEGAETPLEAAVREWGEETGLELPHGTVVGDWLSKDGGYVGNAYLIDYEALLPADLGSGRLVRGGDPGGDEIQAIAWYDPADVQTMPGVRRELKNTPWNLIEDAPRGERTDDPAKVEMGKFRAFTKARAKQGKWRDFQFQTIPAPVAKHLNDTAREQLTKDDRAGTDARPKAGTPSWRDTPPSPQPQHMVDLALTDYWSPRVAESLGELWRDADLASAISSVDGIGDVGLSVFRDVARRVLAGSVQSSTLEQVITNAWADAYHVGVMAAQKQLQSFEPTVDGSNPKGWSDWKPGMTDANKITALGWKEALDNSGHTIKGITDTTMQRLANRIADGVNDGDPSDVIGRSLRDLLDDPARAEKIAVTETARMLNQASMFQYQALGVTQWDWIGSADACSEICIKGIAGGPYRVDQDSLIPAHPYCRCAASPHIEGH